MKRIYSLAFFFCILPFFANAQTWPIYQGAIFSNYIQKDSSGQSEFIAAEILRGGTFYRVPFNYKRTGILNEDIHGLGMVVLEKGAHGYWAGDGWVAQIIKNGVTFDNNLINDSGDTWCFVGKGKLSDEHGLCFKVNKTSSALLLARYKPHLLETYTNSYGQTYDHPLAIEETPLKLVENQIIEYRFLRWERAQISIGIYVENKLQGTQQFPILSDGSARIITIDGSFTAIKTANNRGASFTKIER